jgi:hypothetical protein
LRKEKRKLTQIAVGLLLLTLTIPVVLKETYAAPNTTFSAINPGPGSWTPSSWTAETPNPAEIGTTNFTFHSPQTSVGNTFFVNITVSNVQNMKSWGIGVIFDNTTLAYNGSRRPPDHVFKGAEDAGASMVAPAVVVADFDATHQEVEWGCAYIMPSPSWIFNGTGVMCQLRFQVIAPVNATYPKWTTLLEFDPGWTAVYQHPSGTLIPDFANGRVKYLYPIVPEATVLAINPASVVNPSYTVGSNFTVNLTVTGATDLYQWQAEVYYNNTLLNATSAAEGDFLPTRGTTLFTANILQNFNGTHGQITLTENITGAPLGVYGSGQLAAITFQVLDNGSTPITISSDILYDSDNNPTAHTTINGYFSNVLVPEICIEPPEVRDPTLVPGTEFDINVTISGVQNLKQCTFNLTYNPQVLMEIGMVVPKVLGYPVKYMIIDDYNGFIWVNLTYPNPITTETPLTIFKVTFEVEALGVSPLNLTNTTMQDPDGNPITHDVCNGIFIGLIVDVAITQVTTNKTVAYTTWPVQINVTVINLGNLTETFDVKAYYDTNLIGTKTVTDLDPNNVTTVTLIWNTTLVPACHNYTISAYIPPLPYEINVTNNNMTDGNVKIKLMGDTNGDGIVNMDDISAVLDAFGSYPGHPRWNPNCDLDPNNRIDMSDLVLVLENFGKSC